MLASRARSCSQPLAALEPRLGRRTAPARSLAASLLLAQPLDQDVDAAPVGRAAASVGEALEQLDRDVAVAALAERVGERLDLASAPSR